MFFMVNVNKSEKRSFSDTYSLKRILQIFLACAFPIHVWSLLMVLQDVAWIADRTQVIDAFSYAAYSLLFALVESMVVFLILMILSPLAYSYWKKDEMAAAMISLYYVVVLWAVALQIYYYYKEKIPELDDVIVNKFFIGGALITQWMLMIVLFLLVIASVILPVVMLQRWHRFAPAMNEFISRVTVLTSFYLVFDLFGICLILIRNLYRTELIDLIARF